MVVRIRLSSDSEGRALRSLSTLAGVVGGACVLAAISCLLLALWRLTSDLGWTESFLIEQGFLSHWQVWVTFTLAAAYLAARLLRFSRAREQALARRQNASRSPLDPARKT